MIEVKMKLPSVCTGILRAIGDMGDAGYRKYPLIQTEIRVKCYISDRSKT